MVEYLLEGATLGSSTDGKDFYVLQSLQDGSNCDNDYTDGFTSLNGVKEPTITGASQTTTTLISAVDWPPGTNPLCLRIQLMLQTQDDNDLLWHQVDFTFNVEATYDDGSANVVFNDGGGVGIGGNGPMEATEVVILNNGPIYPGVEPTFDIFFLDQGPFAYGAEIPILIEFHHPLDIFAYSVPEDKVVAVDPTTNQALMDPSGQPITLQSVTFEMTSTDYASGIQGIVTITLPLIIFQMPSISNVGISIPVVWTTKSSSTRRDRRTTNLRSNGWDALAENYSNSSSNNNNNTETTTPNDQEGDDSDSSQESWKKDAIVKLELLPYEQDSSKDATSGSNHRCHFLLIANFLVMSMSLLLWDT